MGPPPGVSEPDAYTAHGAPLGAAPLPWGFGARWGYYTDAETGLLLLTRRIRNMSGALSGTKSTVAAWCCRS